MTTKERIDAAKSYIRGHQPEPTKVVRKRQPYKRGATTFLATFRVGETRKYEGQLVYSTLKSIASKLKSDYGCMYCFSSSPDGKYITRIK